MDRKEPGAWRVFSIGKMWPHADSTLWTPWRCAWWRHGRACGGQRSHCWIPHNPTGALIFQPPAAMLSITASKPFWNLFAFLHFNFIISSGRLRNRWGAGRGTGCCFFFQIYEYQESPTSNKHLDRSLEAHRTPLQAQPCWHCML